MIVAVCSTPGCGAPSAARGLCGSCYQAAYRAGTFTDHALARPVKRGTVHEVVETVTAAQLRVGDDVKVGRTVMRVTRLEATGRRRYPIVLCLDHGRPMGVAATTRFVRRRTATVTTKEP